MFGRMFRRAAIAVAAVALSSVTGAGAAQIAQRRPPDPAATARAINREAYDRGYREGAERGGEDAERGRSFDVSRDDRYRDGDRGYEQRHGSRAAYRDAYRVGFESGYRRGYERVRVVAPGQARRDATVLPPRAARGGRGYQEPASARGYADGFAKGLEDGRDRDRYDPVRHDDYREADQGYSGSYGSKDAYKNNYRAGFRQGYEDGYRDGTRSRR